MEFNARVNKEIQTMMKDNDLYKNNYSIELVGDSKSHLLARIRGAPDSPYERGVFIIDIEIPDKYPFVAPICKFVTKVWHPNISSVTGTICLDILKEQWAAAMTISSVLISLGLFLSSPEPDDPQDAVVARQYKTDKKLFEKTAKYWTLNYAFDEEQRNLLNRSQSKEFKDFEQMIATVMRKKSVTKDTALAELSCNNWILNRVLK